MSTRLGTLARRRHIAVGDNHPDLFDSASGSTLIFVLGQILALNRLAIRHDRTGIGGWMDIIWETLSCLGSLSFSIPHSFRFNQF